LFELKEARAACSSKLTTVGLTSSSEDYETRHPEPADDALIIEVADSSLRQDRNLMPICGGGVVPTSWIVNLSDREVEVYSHPFQAGYHSR
jgi:hypothetical protein